MRGINHQNISNVGKTIINHTQVITINRWYKPFPNGWFTIVLPTLVYDIALLPQHWESASCPSWRRRHSPPESSRTNLRLAANPRLSARSKFGKMLGKCTSMFLHSHGTWKIDENGPFDPFRLMTCRSELFKMLICPSCVRVTNQKWR